MNRQIRCLVKCLEHNQGIEINRISLSWVHLQGAHSCLSTGTGGVAPLNENALWRLGGVPKTVVFDNAKCGVLKADWYDPELHAKIID
jgi:hypothetical protein